MYSKEELEEFSKSRLINIILRNQEDIEELQGEIDELNEKLDYA